MKPEPVLVDTLVENEARAIARDQIERALAKSDLPLPKDHILEFHIDELLKTKPEFREIARKRVEAKEDSYSENLRAIGIETVAVDLDL